MIMPLEPAEHPTVKVLLQRLPGRRPAIEGGEPEPEQKLIPPDGIKNNR